MADSTALLSENLLSLREGALRFPGYRGKRCNAQTLARWIMDGVKLSNGDVLKLEGFRLAGRWLTTAEAITRFLVAQNEAWHADRTDAAESGGGARASPRPPRSAGRRRVASERAARQLEKAGA
jgi:hypothetical protein